MSRLMATAAAAVARRLGLRPAQRAADFMPFPNACGITAASSATAMPAAAGPARGMMPSRCFAASAVTSPAGDTTAKAGKAASRTWKAPADLEERDDRGIQHDLLEKYLSEGCMTAKELERIAMEKARKEFARHDLDCGSSEVQVAVLTTKVQYMIKHLLVHRKDCSSRRGLQRMLETRKKLLRYLRRTDGDRYGNLIFRLGLRDNVISKSKYT